MTRDEFTEGVNAFKALTQQLWNSVKRIIKLIVRHWMRKLSADATMRSIDQFLNETAEELSRPGWHPPMLH